VHISSSKKEAAVAPKLTQPYMQEYLQDSYEKINSQVATLEIEWTAMNNKIDDKQKQLARLSSIRHNRLDLFGDEMVALRNLINLHKDLFIKVPKGPIGACISVRSVSWIPLIEWLLYPFLFIFLVDNKPDYDVLVKMIDKVYDKDPYRPLTADVRRKPDVWIIRFTKKRHILSDTRVPVGLGYTTLLDILKFHGDDPDVFNALHNFTNFERVMLFNTDREAYLRMSESYRLPRNCMVGYTKSFMKIIPHPRFRTISLHRNLTSACEWSSRSSSRGHGPRASEPSVASSKVRLDYARECKRGVKENMGFTQLLQPQMPPSKSRLSVPVRPPNTITLKSNEVYNLDKASQFYLLPSLGPTIDALRDQLRSLELSRDVHQIIIRLNRDQRLGLLKQIEIVESQLKD
jgi:hypothetical protein